jgi:hypothetical protein
MERVRSRFGRACRVLPWNVFWIYVRMTLPVALGRTSGQEPWIFGPSSDS